MRFRFVTSTPLNIVRGSGTFTGIATLAKFLRLAGHTVDFITPTLKFPIYTLERILFNEALRHKRWPHEAITVGFDMDGYSIASSKSSARLSSLAHIASIKGVIADELRFESGLTRATMRLQATLEKKHVQRADRILAPSHYSAGKIQEYYEVCDTPNVIPEAIDLAAWRAALQANPAPAEKNKFIVLCVCRFYPRKRLHLLLNAADRLRQKISGLEIRIVGDGPDARRLKSEWRKKNLNGIVTWLGNLSSDQLAREYNLCHIFCLPSVQEGFGIVFLEAMASAKPIVAARAAAAPEVVRHGLLVDPDNQEALADAIERLYLDADLRQKIANQGSQWVQQFDAPLVANRFLHALSLGNLAPEAN